MRMWTTMELFTHSLFVMLSFVLFVHAQDDQSGFISIDCGLPKSVGGYSEPTTTLNYISDEPFINSGVKMTLPLESQAGYQKQVAHLRAFPEGIRNCYTINVTKGVSYLIRAVFYYGNYDNKNYPPGFDIHIGANYWDTIEFFFDVPIQKEIIHVPLQDYVRVCLANNGTGTPFISAIDLRPMINKTYVTQGGSLKLDTRGDLGSLTNKSYRFPFDALDRGWSRDFNNYKPNWTTISTASIMKSTPGYKPASEVMSTAITPSKPNDPLIYSWYTSGETTSYYMYLHFAEITKLKSNESREFDIFLNGELYYGPLAPEYLNDTTIQSTSPLPSLRELEHNYTLKLVRTGKSTLPPILNAIEIYTLLDLSQSETYEDDVEAITLIKSAYGVKRNWDGDPCGPRKYVWTGLNCSYDGSDPPRITALNLSSSGLTGEISPHILNLTMLESLDLSNNGLSGPFPKFLSQLTNLKVLNLERNKLSGPIPAELLAKLKNNSLKFSFDETSTPNTCVSPPCKTKKKNKVLIPILSSVGGLVVILLTVAAVFVGLKKKKKQVRSEDESRVIMEPSIQSDAFETKKRQFTYSEVVDFTNDFETILGRGGFGTVYHGFIGDTQVAVKKLSHSTSHGYQQFQAEVKLLMTVYHRNLTSLVGYCSEGTNMALIYEYMTNGDLDSHILGDGNSHVLSWEERLQIALDSAQGLEYLHNGCKPPIVHRDIKPANILLNDNMQAKLADFGLSKSFPTDGGTHMSTVVAGTPGYLDPEYSLTNRLTEKSDVYSFGVVLMQIITSRTAILTKGAERTHISQWVSFMLSNGDIKSVIDQRLGNNFDTNSVWKAAELALACVSQKSSARPNMSHVVFELKECLEAESTRCKFTRLMDSKNSSKEFSADYAAEFSPIPR